MSTSANAGKVMLGADGCPLRGHDGKIVLADNLYPKRLTLWDITAWSRGNTSSGLGEKYVSLVSSTPLADADCVSPVWEDSWASATPSTGAYYYRRAQDWGDEPPYWRIDWRTPQYVLKLHSFTGPGGAEINWNRVSSVKINWSITANTPNAVDYHVNFYRGGESPTLPSGSNEPWTGSGWSLLASIKLDGSQAWMDTIASGSFSVTPDSGGIVWHLAHFASEPGGTDNQTAGVDVMRINWWFDGYPEVIYNLAT